MTDNLNLMKEATFSIYLARSLLQFAAHRGADVEALCATTGFDMTMLKTPDQRVSKPLYYAYGRRQ
jgi:hypothetical protein